MAESLRHPGKKKSERADRLTHAAQRLFHRHGVHGVSLRDVAAAAKVPPGGVFYHFPTKARLVRAAAETRRADVAALLARLEERIADPDARLDALAAALAETAGPNARHGCPILRMTADLAGAHGEEAVAREAMRETMAMLQAFVARTLKARGRPARAAAEGGRRFLVLWQGAIALAVVEGDRAVLTAELAALPERLRAPRRPRRRA